LDAERYHTLVLSDSGSRQNAERTRAQDQTARAAVASAQAALAAANQQLSVLAANIDEAAAAVAQAQADLQTARLISVMPKSFHPLAAMSATVPLGRHYVSQGTYLLTIVPAHGLWVDASSRKTSSRECNRAASDHCRRHAAGHVFHGHVLSLAPATGAVFSVIPPENATGNSPDRAASSGADRSG